MSVSRRGFLKMGAAGLAMAATSSFAAEGKKPGMAVQLYSIRGLCGKDFVEALKQVATMGYKGVQFAGYYQFGSKPAELRKVLDDLGLKVAGTHIGLGSILPNEINKTIDFNATIGNKYLNIPGMGPDKNWKGNLGDWWKKTAGDFGVAAETAKKAGMYVGYHNHSHEFKTKVKEHDNKCLWEILWSNTSKEVSMEMDLGWAVHAGEDPVYWMRKFPNPMYTVHAKETSGNGILGQPAAGQKGVDWDACFPVLENEKKLQWYVVESEANSNTYENIRQCFEFLKTKGRC